MCKYILIHVLAALCVDMFICKYTQAYHAGSNYHQANSCQTAYSFQVPAICTGQRSVRSNTPEKMPKWTVEVWGSLSLPNVWGWRARSTPVECLMNRLVCLLGCSSRHFLYHLVTQSHEWRLPNGNSADLSDQLANRLLAVSPVLVTDCQPPNQQGRWSFQGAFTRGVADGVLIRFCEAAAKWFRSPQSTISWVTIGLLATLEGTALGGNNHI